MNNNFVGQMEEDEMRWSERQEANSEASVSELKVVRVPMRRMLSSAESLAMQYVMYSRHFVKMEAN
jgi:hypothetical protein